MTIAIYGVTRAFPREELYGLSQLRRSAAAIGANFAEGSGRRSSNEICRFLQIARGSASETEYHVLLARDLKYLTEEEFRQLARQTDEVQRILTALIQSLRPANSETLQVDGKPHGKRADFAHCS
jgi:four helix bundle protein